MATGSAGHSVQGLVLFAHGARDPRWAEPFERIRQRVAERNPAVKVALAFLELMHPDLAEASAALVGSGCEDILVVPVFLGQGGHVREDLPRQIDAVRRSHPTVRITNAPAVVEDEAVIEAIARYAIDRLVAVKQ